MTELFVGVCEKLRHYILNIKSLQEQVMCASQDESLPFSELKGD